MNKRIALLGGMAHFLHAAMTENIPVVVIDNKPEPGPYQKTIEAVRQDAKLTTPLSVPPSYREDDTMRYYTVKGRPVYARNRKMAEKIYRNNTK